MSEEFKREDRYIVIKRKHLDLLTNKAKEDLEDIVTAIRLARQIDFDTGVDDIECVVVEKDWPMYEEVWSMIKDFANGENTRADDLISRKEVIEAIDKAEYFSFSKMEIKELINAIGREK